MPRDKVPFRLKVNGMIEASSTMPFHGIVSMGLLDNDVDVWGGMRLLLLPFLNGDKNVIS